MAYPGQGEIFNADPLDEWIDEHFLRSDPAAFAATSFWPTVTLVSRSLSVDANGVYCIGSGAIGLSLNPGKVTNGILKSFDNESDIDLAVISEVHFEMAWRDLRKAAHPVLRSEMEAGLATRLDWQRKRFFDGIILANKLLPYLTFGSEWIGHLTKIGEQVNIVIGRSVPVNVWIFRDYWSLRTYIVGGVVLCREKVI